MKLTKHIEFIDLSIYLPHHKTLIISDIHIGYEEALNKQGFLIPRIHFKEQVEKVKQIIEKVKFESIIINGDLKEEFGNISETEWRNTLQFLDLFKDKKIVLVEGNHDKMLEPIAKKRNIQIVENYIIGDILVTHGDIIPKIDKKIKTIIIGHEHPAISLSDEHRDENFKCYLVGKFITKTLIVQPSFKLLTRGTDIKEKKFLSPFLNDIDDFKVYIVDDNIYDFGKVKNL